MLPPPIWKLDNNVAGAEVNAAARFLLIRAVGRPSSPAGADEVVLEEVLQGIELQQIGQRSRLPALAPERLKSPVQGFKPIEFSGAGHAIVMNGSADDSKRAFMTPFQRPARTLYDLPL